MSFRAFQNPLDGSPVGNDMIAIRLALRALGLSYQRDSSLPAPGVLWISRSATLVESVEIPANVTLAFAPGARLTLDPGLLLTIGGPLDAGMEPRFVLGEGARVLLTGPLDEIHAVWWEERDPLQRLTDGASVVHALEALWSRYASDLDPAPIVVGGPYLLRETLRIAPPAGLPGAFDVVLRGRCYGLSAPITFALADEESLRVPVALVLVEGRVVLTLEHVGLSTRRSARLQPTAAALRLAGDHDGSRIEACYFDVARSTGLAFVASSSGPGNALVDFLAGLQRLTGPAPRVTVSRCVFSCDLGVGAGPVAGPFDPNPQAHAVGINVDLTAPTSLRVTDSQFMGAYKAAIYFVGTELTVTACTFDNIIFVPAYDPLIGHDICLGPGWVLDSAVRGTNAHLTVTHCISTSPSFLMARPVFTSSDPGGAVLTNVIHRPPESGPYSGAASILWSERYGPRSLILQGCELGAHVSLGTSGHSGIVIDLGTQFDIVAGTRSPYVGGGPNAVYNLQPTP